MKNFSTSIQNLGHYCLSLLLLAAFAIGNNVALAQCATTAADPTSGAWSAIANPTCAQQGPVGGQGANSYTYYSNGAMANCYMDWYLATAGTVTCAQTQYWNGADVGPNVSCQNTWNTSLAPSGTSYVKCLVSGTWAAGTSTVLYYKYSTPGTPTASSMPTTACINTATTYTAVGTGSTTTGVAANSYYIWSVTGVAATYSSTTSSPSQNITFTGTGTASVQITASNNGVCNGGTLTTSVTVYGNTVAPTLNTATPGSGNTICAGYSTSATINAGSGGGSGAGDTYQYSINNGSTWTAYTSGASINTTGATGNVLVRVSRSAGTPGCGGALGPNTIATWPVGSAVVAPSLGSASPGSGTTVCQSYGNVSATITAGSGGSSGAADSYRYSTDGGSTWNTYTSGSNIATASATGSIIVQAMRSSGSYGCTGTSFTTVASWPVTATPAAPSLTTAQSFCSASSPTIASLSTSGATGTVKWYAASSGGSALPSTNALVSGTTYYASQTISGCESVTRTGVTATIVTTPSGGSIATVTFCTTPGIATMTVTGVSNATQYSWALPAGLTGSSTSNSITLSGSTTGTYTVTVTPQDVASGVTCSGAQVTGTAIINTPSSAVTGISGGGGTICQGSGVTLTASGGSLGTGANYQWGTGTTVGTNPIGGATSISYTPSPSSTTSYWVSVTGPAPCGSAGGTYTTVNVNTPSTAVTSISGGGGTICQGSGVTLTASGGSLGTGANYQWGTGTVVGTNPIGGATSISYTPSPSSTTSYWVSVTGPSPCNGAGGTYTTVNVNTPSTAVTSISGGGGTICQGSGVTLTASGGSLGTGANYQWGTGTVVGTNPIGGATSISYTPSPSSTTSYWVSVTGPSPCNGAGGTYTTVNVNTPSTAVTSISGTTSVCSGNGTTLTAVGGSLGTGANYQWGTGNVVGTSPIAGATSVSYSVTPGSTTDYWVSVTGPSPCNGAGGVSTTVNVTTTPTPTFTAVPSNPSCNYTSVTYTTQSGYSNYVWSGFGTPGTDYNIISGGLSATDYTVTLQWISTGTKAVSVSYSNGSCPAVTPGTNTTVVNASPSPSLSTSGAFCTSNSVVYTTQSGNSNYIWTIGGTAGVDYTLIAGGTTSAYSATIQWITTGSKTVSVNYTNGSGCTGPTAASTSNAVNNGPSGAAISDNIDPCNGGHTAYVVVTGGTSPYNFTVCGTPYTNQASPFELDATSNTSCSLSLVSDANGCTPGTISGSPVSYPSRVLTSGDTYACTVSTGATKIFYDNSGNLMVKITDGGNTLGSTNVDVTVDGYVHQFGPTTPQSYLQRHFKISPTNTSGAASVCLYMSDAEVTALSTASATDNHFAPSYYSTFSMGNAVVTKFHGGAETPLSNTSRIVLTPTSKTHNPVVNGVTYNNVWEVCMNVSNWSGFYIHAQNVNNTPLPVTLLYLTADAIDNKYIDLDWATASEINNKGFAVERSTNGTDFTQIGWVDGHGNSNTQLSYSYSDRTVQPGVVYYYRLKQVDFDGQSTYSEIVSASLIGDKGFSFEDMIPNPATNAVQLGILTTAGQKATVTMTDMLGRVVLSQPWQLAEGYNINTFDLSNIAAGTYNVTVYTGSIYMSKKLVVTK